MIGHASQAEILGYPLPQWWPPFDQQIELGQDKGTDGLSTPWQMECGVSLFVAHLEIDFCRK